VYRPLAGIAATRPIALIRHRRRGRNPLIAELAEAAIGSTSE